MEYVNFISVDRNFVPQTDISQTNFVRITEAAKESGANGGNGLRERLYAEVTVKQAGYMYIYLSNDNPTVAEVYFDDFKVTQIKSPVIASEDYYPFGLSFNSYQRENSVKQDFKYNGKELQDELNLGWLDYGARMYMSDIGRWGVIDPLAELGRRWSPYNYAFDNPIRYLDPDGMWPSEGFFKPIGSGFAKLGQALTNSKTYESIGKGFQQFGQAFKKDIADRVEVNASAGAVVGLKVGNKVGAELNFGTKELGSASTANGFQNSNSEVVTKGGSVSYGAGEISLETKTTTLSSTMTSEPIPGFKMQQGVTTETTVSTASASIAGVGVESTKTNTTTSIEGGGSFRTEGSRQTNFSFEQGAVVPQKDVKVGSNIFTISLGIKIDISIK